MFSRVQIMFFLKPLEKIFKKLREVILALMTHLETIGDAQFEKLWTNILIDIWLPYHSCLRKCKTELLTVWKIREIK